MSVIAIKPHKLVQIIYTAGYEDENGDFYEGRRKCGISEDCDAVPAGKPNEITFADGSTHHYTFQCVMKPDCRQYFIGERVLLRREQANYELVVIGFVRYQHQAKVYLE